MNRFVLLILLSFICSNTVVFAACEEIETLSFKTYEENKKQQNCMEEILTGIKEILKIYEQYHSDVLMEQINLNRDDAECREAEALADENPEIFRANVEDACGNYRKRSERYYKVLEYYNLIKKRIPGVEMEKRALDQKIRILKNAQDRFNREN